MSAVYSSRGSSPWIYAFGSLLALILLTAWFRSGRGGTSSSGEELMVYCAAGIRLPVEAAAAEFEKETGVSVRLDYGSSGALEGKLALGQQAGANRADLYIPADVSFAERTRANGLTVETIPLATFRLVLGVSKSLPEAQADSLTSVSDLLDAGLGYSFCDQKAGAGKMTKQLLEQAGMWERLEEQAKVVFPTVTETAQAVAESKDVQAGFVWDTTAQQFGLRNVRLKELEAGESMIVAAVTAGSRNPALALRFARYLAATDRGQTSFEKHFFARLDGDPWRAEPELNLYCGGVNRNALDETLREFEKREGCVIRENFAGCGQLVAGIKSIQNGRSQAGMPDVFMTCDVTYMTRVQELFGEASDVSSTKIVLLVRAGNPKQITNLKELSREGIRIGTTDKALSTLGYLSWQLFEEMGIRSAIEARRGVVVTTPTAHELILQMEGHDKLDVALVYEANCHNLEAGKFEQIAIDHPLAVAVQNIAVRKGAACPQLAGRLIQTILSPVSRDRFMTCGFDWQGHGHESNR